jgi:hypothetical protein
LFKLFNLILFIQFNYNINIKIKFYFKSLLVFELSNFLSKKKIKKLKKKKYFYILNFIINIIYIYKSYLYSLFSTFFKKKLKTFYRHTMPLSIIRIPRIMHSDYLHILIEYRGTAMTPVSPTRVF